ncbi:hypothetical protein KL905_000759 [Ogataea polymorpha]|uniref:Uncharacterized protein n=1 Tax=Ogataea polymorpha TaxID=460523 RepID=A0A1B7SGG3_9ASCO|nr:uncharacterized protein OGAPODRAFT_16473 [Ogataea polymorpha]KAG7881755.1 hypothetical protein KL937_001378 [Ogataea polymorpha]KAG7890900.1 hypothetical protein KL936_002184 [Ogataea polymorpha]KAG7894047.1 hypothetical protein KL908_002324 [Ogataea polymorpha]KAG7902001.1 hypothetical protein KL935_001961 [Ogataea polymorpha]KAG7910518.1 hypothetical protein KL907_001409 [Ogataea polymorpha]
MVLSTPLKFKAGKVDYNEETKVYTPNPTKGEIVISQSDEGDEFYLFVWKPRETTVGGVEPEELLVIAGDVTWKKVNSCKTGRVYMLTFLSSGAKNLFWMQEINDDENDPSKETEKDKEIFRKINDLFKESE